MTVHTHRQSSDLLLPMSVFDDWDILMGCTSPVFLTHVACSLLQAAELPDDAATIAAAGLQNAVVVQKPAVGGD